MIGRTLGHYEILEKLGEGGMGVVYKARDTRLNRLVALKVLPPERVADVARKQRFVQEAQAASALNHPNIITIHDIASEDGTDYMVMEYVAGKALDHLCARRGLRLTEALKYAAQIADALGAAHRAGIVHRDLKPSNVMVTGPEGRPGLVKVLDFGLAKLTEREEADDDAAATRTLRLEAVKSEEGTIVGTVAYMSPEQAEGRKVDGRSDIFSFGAVLYEMVTGQRAFGGGSKISTLSAILKEEPKPASSLAPEVPHDVEKIIGRCLRKDPERRFQTMADLKVALEEVREDLESGRLSRVPAAVAARPTVKRRWAPVAIGAVVLVLLAAAGVAWWFARGRQPAATTPVRLTSDLGLSASMDISPDGKLLLFMSDRSGEGHWDLWLKQIPNGQPVRLTREPGDAVGASFSPDGTQIAFFSDRDGGGIYVMPALGGGTPKLLARNGLAPHFSPDGKQILFERHERPRYNLSAMHLIPVSGGEEKPFRPDYWVAYSLWTPDGSHILFVGIGYPPKPGEQLRWLVAALDGSQVVEVNSAQFAKAHGLDLGLPGLCLAGSRGGTLRVVFSAMKGGHGNLWLAEMSPKAWQLEGEPQRLTYGMETADVLPAATAEGRVVFTSATRNDNIWMLPVDANQGKASGEKQRMSQEARYEALPFISRDGKKAAYFASPYFTNTLPDGVYVREIASGAETLLVPRKDNVGYPVLNADGSRLAYATRKDGKSLIDIVSTSGGAPEVLCEDCGGPRDWSPDGKWLLTQTGDRESRFFAVNVASREKKELLREPEHGLFSGQFSPDSRSIAFLARNRQNAQRLYVTRFRDGAAPPRPQWIEITDGKAADDKPRWAPNGNLLYFRSDRDGVQAIWAQRLDPQTKRPVKEPFVVYQLRRGLAMEAERETDLAVAIDKIVFSHTEYRGNAWMVQLPE